MYNRFIRSLSKPSEIIIYIKDSWKRVWLYFFLLVVLALTPFFIETATVSGFTTSTHQAIHDVFTTELRGNYQIDNYKLDLSNLADDENLSASIGLYNIYINKNDNLNWDFFYFNFKEEGISIHALGIQVGYYTYNQLSIETHNFNDVSVSSVSRISNALEIVYQNSNQAAIFLEMITYFVVIAAELLIMIVITSMFVTKPILFKHKFKINIYVATIYAVSIMLANLFGISIISYIGLGFMIVYSNRAFSRIVTINGK